MTSKEQGRVLITVVTVVLNAEKTIARTIESVLTQSYKNIEYIIIDGGSSDGTVDVIKRYREMIAYFVSEPDDGIYDAMNKGIKKAHGDIIGLLNADDWYEPNALSIVADEYDKGKQIVVGRTFVVDNHGNKRLFRQRDVSDLWIGMPDTHQAFFISKKVYDTYGLYDTKYRISADYELILRMYHNEVAIYTLNKVFVNFSTGGLSLTENVRGTEEYKDIIQKYKFFYPDKLDKIDRLCEERIRNAKGVTILLNPTTSSSFFRKFAYKKTNHISIWGAGLCGERLANFVKGSDMTIDFFVDSDPKKQNHFFCGADVKSSDELKNYEGSVFIAVMDHDKEIADRIAAMNNPKLTCVLFSDLLYAAAEYYDEFKRGNGSPVPLLS